MTTPNMSNAACYIPFVGFIPAIVFLIIEKNPKVKFHAVQGLLLFAAWFVLNFLPVLGILSTLVFFVLWLVLATKAYQGETVRLPFLSEWAEKIIKKV